MSAIQFTTLIRLPFVRGDFVDPPQADWNAAKDRALWKVISKSSKTSDLNWVELATRFQVPPAFILQQAAWLYERHLEHVRSQMKKVGGANASTTSGIGGSSTTTGGVPMQRGGSAGSRGTTHAMAARTPSALSVRPRDSPVLRTESSTPAAVVSSTHPPLSRTPSTNTITQSRAHSQQAPTRTQSQRAARPSMTGQRPVVPTQPTIVSPSDSLRLGSPSVAASSSSGSSTSDSDMENPAHRSQLFKRPPRFQKQRPRELSAYDESPEDEGDDTEHSGNVSLPFAQGPIEPSTALPDRSKRMSNFPPSNRNRQPTSSSSGKQVRALDASSSLASSASDAPRPSNAGPGPISPKHRAELARLSPRGKGKRDGSDGTPSMGSSFSDIDDAGISQSALEEALLSNIQHGRISKSQSSLSPTIQQHATSLQDGVAQTHQTNPPDTRHPRYGPHLPPPLTTHYINRSTTIFLPAITLAIKALPTHHGRGKLGMNPSTNTLALQPCSDSFLSLQTTCTAHLVDYFADFYPYDTPPMQTLWFHLFDIIQESAKLPHSFWHAQIPSCDHAEPFNQNWLRTLALINKVIHSRRGMSGLTSEDMVHYTGVTGLTFEAVFRLGQWKAGLRPWQQFLCDGSPGLGIGEKKRIYKGLGDMQGTTPVTATTTAAKGNGQQKDAMGKKVEVKDKVAEVQVPMGGLAIVNRHTQRARLVAQKYAVANDHVDEDDLLGEFDRHSLKIGTTRTYTSLTGYPTTLQNMYPADHNEAPKRHDDYLAGLDMGATHVPLWLVDEGIGLCKGTAPFDHPCGNDEFHMWTMTTGSQRETRSKEDVLAKVNWDDMWDEWKLA